MHDVIAGHALLASAPPMPQFIGDKAYAANDVPGLLADQGTEAVIPPMPRRLMLPSCDPIADKLRNIIKRAVCTLKDHA